MAKPKATIDPSDVRHPSPDLELALQGQRQLPSREQLAYIHTRYWDLKAAMDRLMNRTDGWLRIIPKPDDDRIYIKWKYTSGCYAGRYVMAVVKSQQLPEGLHLIGHKVQQADQALLTPTRDTAYDAEG